MTWLMLSLQHVTWSATSSATRGQTTVRERDRLFGQGTVLTFASLVLITVFFDDQGRCFLKGVDGSLERPVTHSVAAAPLAGNGVLSQTMSTAATTWYGIRQVPKEDLQTVADHLGGSVVALGFEVQEAGLINARLDLAQSLGYRVVVVLGDESTCSKRPWKWNGSEWVFSQSTIETLQGIAHHPALLAINALHEPFDTSNECHWTVEQQQELYQLLKNYTDGLPVWSDIAGVAIWESRGIQLADGICDYCGTFHHRFRSDWSSEQCLEEILGWIDADLDTQRRLMPNSQVVFQIQTFSYAGYQYPLRFPTTSELGTVRNHLCALHQPMMYYPWSHGTYDSTLKDAPQLWPVVARGCADFKVTDLSVVAAISDTSSLTLTLRWTAPMAAVTYTLRSSDTLVTTINWDHAPIVTVPFTASTPGSIKWLTTSVNYTGRTLYFALKSQNSMGDWSELSNNAFWPHSDVYLPLITKSHVS